MALELPHRFVKISPNRIARSGQGEAFQARDAETGTFVFVKELKNSSWTKNRKRFYREVSAYKTLESKYVPTLLWDNADAWEDKDTPLALVTDWVEGETLQRRVRRQPLALADALELGLLLCNAVAECHDAEVFHRDIKPANVMLAAGDTRHPRLVDFGMSYLALEDAQDLTRFEEIGNRFLRLPEHARGGDSHGPVADVTHVAGLIFYGLTGVEPTVLVDGDGRAPHQRPEATQKLRHVADESTRVKLMGLFDRAFTQPVSLRYQTAEDLAAAIESILRPPAQRDATAIQKAFEEATANPSHRSAGYQVDNLTRAIGQSHQAALDLAKSAHLHCSQTAQTIETVGTYAFSQTMLRLQPPGVAESEIRTAYLTVRIESRGNEFVMLLDGSEVWRGNEVESHLDRTKLLRIALMESYVVAYT